MGRSPRLAIFQEELLLPAAALCCPKRRRDSMGREAEQGLSGTASLHAAEQSRNLGGPAPESWVASNVRATATLPGAENGHCEQLLLGLDAGEGDGVCQPWCAKKADPRALPPETMVPKFWNGSREPALLTCHQAVLRQVVLGPCLESGVKWAWGGSQGSRGGSGAQGQQRRNL